MPTFVWNYDKARRIAYLKLETLYASKLTQLLCAHIFFLLIYAQQVVQSYFGCFVSELYNIECSWTVFVFCKKPIQIRILSRTQVPIYCIYMLLHWSSGSVFSSCLAYYEIQQILFRHENGLGKQIVLTYQFLTAICKSHYIHLFVMTCYVGIYYMQLSVRMRKETYELDLFVIHREVRTITHEHVYLYFSLPLRNLLLFDSVCGLETIWVGLMDNTA